MKSTGSFNDMMMKALMYISGIGGTILLALRLLGSVMEFRENDAFLVAGLVLLGVVFLPLMLYYRHRQNKKINSIIKSYEGREKETPPSDGNDPGTGGRAKGWGMNNSPFRERKSGLTWGGGNIKAAEATRGTRRQFLRR